MKNQKVRVMVRTMIIGEFKDSHDLVDHLDDSLQGLKVEHSIGTLGGYRFNYDDYSLSSDGDNYFLDYALTSASGEYLTALAVTSQMLVEASIQIRKDLEEPSGDLFSEGQIIIELGDEVLDKVALWDYNS